MRVTDCAVLTLSMRSPRLAAFRAWERSHALPLSWPAVRTLVGFDGRTLPPPPSGPDDRHARGCALTHAAALRWFAGRPGAADDWLVLLEDDCRWGGELPRAWPDVAAAVPPDADVLFVGGAAAGDHSRGERLGARLTRIRGVYRLHCYAVRRGAAARVADVMASAPGEHCDVLLSRATEAGTVAAVAADPFVCAQESTPGYWYSWNPGEPVAPAADLERYAREVLGMPAAPCAFRGERLSATACVALDLNPVKDWAPCSHPARPLNADHVCPCAGCGAGCPGYARGALEGG